MKQWKMARSRWFYLGVPILCIVVGFVGAADNLITLAINDTYHPIASTGYSRFAVIIYAGLAIAGLISLIFMAITKFAFRSPSRMSILASSLGIWLVGVVFLALTASPGEDSYKRTFQGQRYAIPWDRVTGEMTRRGNPLGRWDTVAMIGLRYCAKPFDVTRTDANCDRPASFLAGKENLAGNGYLRDDQHDPDRRGLRAHLEMQQRERETSGAPLSDTSTASLASSSASGGSPDRPWGRIDAVRQADIGGMMAFKRVSSYPSDDAIYLFSKAEPSDASAHHAECRRGIRNGEVEDREFVCTHFMREGQSAWLFDLPLGETERASIRLSQLRLQLAHYRARSSQVKAGLN